MLNVNGSSERNPCRAGLRGILLRNGDGGWLAGTFGLLGIAGSLQMELATLLHGLQLALPRAICQLQCYTDSTMAVAMCTASEVLFITMLLSFGVYKR